VLPLATLLIPCRPTNSFNFNAFYISARRMLALVRAEQLSLSLPLSLPLSQSFVRLLVCSFALTAVVWVYSVHCTGVHLQNLSVTVCVRICVCVLCLLACCLPAGCFFSVGQFICDFSMADWGTRRSVLVSNANRYDKKFDVNFCPVLGVARVIQSYHNKLKVK